MLYKKRSDLVEFSFQTLNWHKRHNIIDYQMSGNFAHTAKCNLASRPLVTTLIYPLILIEEYKPIIIGVCSFNQ